MPRFIEVTDFITQVHYCRMNKENTERSKPKGISSIYIDDSVYPVSSYGCGMGMAIEDDYQLAKLPDGFDLRDHSDVTTNIGHYENLRVNHATKTQSALASPAGYYRAYLTLWRG